MVYRLQRKYQISGMTLESKVKVKYAETCLSDHNASFSFIFMESIHIDVNDGFILLI